MTKEELEKENAELQEKISVLLSCKKCPENKGGKGFEIEHREPTSRKCVDYCICKEKCSFYKSLHREPESGLVE